MSTTTTPAEALAAFIDRHRITIDPHYVGGLHTGTHPSLHWRIDILIAGRKVMTTPYIAGAGHCPAHQATIKELGHKRSLMREEAIRRECETGRHWRTGAPIHPDTTSVIACIANDAQAIDYPTYEDYAAMTGDSLDSRAGEQNYRICLETALKLRAALGEPRFSELRELAASY